MYEFPSVSELAHLIGAELTRVCLDPYDVQLVFGESSIVAEKAIEQVEPDGTVWHFKCVASEASPAMLHRLVGKKITAIRSEGLRLSIDFDNGAALIVLSEIGPYEPGHIGGQGRFIVF